MNPHTPHDDTVIWKRLVNSYLDLSQALKEFFSQGRERVSLVREGFAQGDIPAALYVSRYMAVSELCQLFNELIHISISPAYAGTAREIILLLPKEWILSHIEEVVEPILQHDTEEEFRRIFELYLNLEKTLAYRLAERAINHPNKEIKEAGEDFFYILSQE